MTDTLSRNEDIKARSDFLRGTLAEELGEQAFGGLSEDDGQLVKFHGMYVQDDRDLRPERAKRKLDRAYMFMARLRVPGGVLTPRQYLSMDRLATERGNATLRFTTRQTIQFHGIIKSNVRAATRAMDAALLDTIAACGDVNRNVMAVGNPYLSRAHGEAVEAARRLSAHFLPRTGAWREIFIGDRRVLGGEPEAEPIYGPTYLPRKFKMTVAVPPSNDVDVFAHDLSFIAIVENGGIVGYNVVVGGGMGATHGEPETYPRVGDIIGYCPADQLVAVAEAVLTTQRDFGNRSNRKRARLKYTIDDRGLDWFKTEVNSRLAKPLEPERKFQFTGNGDALGWTRDEEGLNHLTLFVENGRVADRGDWRLKSALVAIASLEGFIDRGAVIMTANQNVIVARATDGEREKIDLILAGHGVIQSQSALRESAMACVALPTCGLALAESERYLPDLITMIDQMLATHGLSEQKITLRMTGCPNGCARPYIAEIGLIGRNPGRYNLHLGGAADGSRLNSLLHENLNEAEILESLDPLFAAYAKNREPGEGFGDFTRRTGII
ncbi:NADPH-dependent assimilatory sulfite reductase hemoprotein subunit [Acidiphilium sp. AL]|uniref:NADPH-dependent assimilatory sulfite reductase hemoprotein subunit n=1 Tax=Acidiphilium sp. AL TaxID=2871704 RepID=UPI0021CB860F|nr:NADPH-dependent assimilatory sulfite reductase hemoprotein subunit [Acidiphilium sp. AL]MCU4161862.1 NADPH-dependent assimilatory sulfite reductase hemoprotein subunit [Acidiphilium sp. AL]